MTTPSGYTALDFVGYTDKGTYSASATYVKNDLVHYDNSIWRCLLDDTTGQTPAEGTYWTIFINASTIYPVGSIYMSVNATSPASLFGGTWEQLKDRFLLAAGDTYAAGSTGGEATHTLTVDEMPQHGHILAGYTIVWTDIGEIQSSATGPFKRSKPEGSEYTGNAGNSQPHNNMPPYLAVYAWKRIA